MKNLILITILLFATYNCRAQTIPQNIIDKYRYIVNLIKDNNVDALSKEIEYPLYRQNPLPDITSAKEFKFYYSTLLDSNFIKKIQFYNDTDVFEHNFEYGLVGGPFNGDIWMNEKGKLVSINWHSKKEIALKNRISRRIKSSIYPGINQWKENLIVYRSKKLLIRVDYTKNGIRYVCWNHGGPISKKPDLVLYNGVEEQEGEMGGTMWTFTNGEWKYVVDDIKMAETTSECGLFLEISHKGTLKSTIRLKEIK
jgi:hypothetical protein